MISLWILSHSLSVFDFLKYAPLLFPIFCALINETHSHKIIIKAISQWKSHVHATQAFLACFLVQRSSSSCKKSFVCPAFHLAQREIDRFYFTSISFHPLNFRTFFTFDALSIFHFAFVRYLRTWDKHASYVKINISRSTFLIRVHKSLFAYCSRNSIDKKTNTKWIERLLQWFPWKQYTSHFNQLIKRCDIMC